MAHLKRNELPKNWPIQRKGTKFIAVPSHSINAGISLLFILRDILKIAKTRKEAKFMTLNGLVKVNNKIRRDENFPILVNDTISLEKSKEYYRLEIVNRKYHLNKIQEKETEKKIIKILGKKCIGKDKFQMNLRDGHNIITKENFSVGASIIYNTKENKIIKILPLKEGSNVEIISGKHAGEKGKIISLENLSRGTNYIIKLKDKQVVLPFKTILVIE